MEKKMLRRLSKRERLIQKLDDWTFEFGVEKAFMGFFLLWTLVFIIWNF